MFNIFRLIQSDWSTYFRLHKSRNIFLFFLVFFHNPGMFFSLIYRIEHSFFSSKFILFRFIGYILFPFYFLITYYVLDIDIPPNIPIGPGLYIHNKGIVIACTAVIGSEVSIVGQVTIGTKNVNDDCSNDDRSAVIGNKVVIGTGARIIGNVKIGDNVFIGANAVVVKDVPSNCVVGGVPAKFIRQRRPVL